MSFARHMAGYDDLRTLYQVDALHAWRHGENFPPIHVEISPTSWCNQRCRYCYTHKREVSETLKAHVLVNAFRQMAQTGVKAVLVQGTGEPLLHPDLPEAVAVGAEAGLSVALCTNGVLFGSLAQEMMLRHLFSVRFSVLDSDPQRYANTHGCQAWQWGKVVENIRAAAEMREQRGYGCALMGTVYLTRENFHDAYEIVRFFRDAGLDYIFVQEATYTEHSPVGKEQYTSVHFDAQQIGEMRERLAFLDSDQCRVRVRFPFADAELYGTNWREDYCHGIRFLSVISSDGGVYPCWRAWGNKELCYGSLYENTFAEIWNGERRKEIEQMILTRPPQGDECRNCNTPKVNRILSELRGATSRWRDFIA